MKASIRPKKLILYLTKRCDSRCPFCTWILKDPDFFHTRADLDMSLETAKQIVDYYYSIGVRTVRLQAEGEVLLYAHLHELLLYCKKIGYKGFDFPTNAIQLDKHIDFVLKYLSSISISIDGHNAEMFIKHRGGTEAVFNKVINNTMKLSQRKREIKSKTRILVNCVMHAGDYDKVMPMIELAENLGVNVIRFSNYHAIAGGKGLQAVSASDLTRIKNIIDKRNNKVEVKFPSPKNTKNIEKSKKKGYGFSCGQLSNVALVGSELNFAPCCRIDSSPEWGNFNDNGKHNNSRLLNFRETFINARKTSELPIDCQNCTKLKAKRK